MPQPQVQAENIKPENTREAQNSDQAIEAIRASLGRLRFGTIAVTIHEGRVVQIEVTEKMRF